MENDAGAKRFVSLIFIASAGAVWAYFILGLPSPMRDVGLPFVVLGTGIWLFKAGHVWPRKTQESSVKNYEKQFPGRG